ncbi:hypothetical protein FIV42_22080 [Persicimonas caeni]|uniref:Uncharacterized protein n=1 Tax=Persicimonas caeni TaxID=2292766 RepID=A0A4Y6Q007_PERCE|nr:hypothetical protein [Persicimonas caeni]QDG53335.1 hypothetical protein FIV42_22080 [Persicimonas caeni]QED34556.1 hypothetical protein FRD00_22075 [Persicimonas caeni]
MHSRYPSLPSTKLVVTALLVSGLLFTGCDKGSDAEPAEETPAGAEKAEAEKPEAPKVDLPETRELNPYEMDASEPVTAKNLHDEVAAWKEAWKGKEVSIIVWTRNGLSPKNPMKFSTREKPGLIRFQATMPDEERPKLGKAGVKTGYAVLKGKVKLPSLGQKLTFEDAVAVGPYEKEEVPTGQKLDPNELDANTPVNPLDVEAAIDAWKGVKVHLEDQADIPGAGNIVSFPKPGTEKEKFVEARIAGGVPKGLPDEAVKTLECEVDGMKQGSFDPAPYLKLSKCSFVD